MTVSSVASFTPAVYASENLANAENPQRILLSKKLLKIAEGGDVKVIQRLLDQKASVNALDSNDLTPLHLAAINGHAAAMKLLIAAGANIYACAKSGNTPMTEAILRNHIDVVKVLTEAKYDVNRKSVRMPLDICHGTDFEMIKHLLDQKANVALTPQAIFPATMHPATLALLLQHGAHVNTRKESSLDQGAQPLHYAAKRTGDIKIFRILIEAKADPHAVDAKGQTPFNLFSIQLKSRELDYIGLQKETEILEIFKLLTK